MGTGQQWYESVITLERRRWHDIHIGNNFPAPVLDGLTRRAVVTYYAPVPPYFSKHGLWQAAVLHLYLTVLQGNAPSGMPPSQPQGQDNNKDNKDKKAEPPKKKWEPPLPTRVGKKKRRGPATASKLPPVFPATRCRLRLLKMDRIKDYLLLEEEFIHNQERMKPESSREEKNQDERSKVDDIRGTPMMVGTLEEIVDDDHAIISTASGPESYVSIMSFVDKDRIEPGCSVLLNHKNQAVVGVLEDDTDPLVSVMKLDKAPTESYADIGGLENQIQEIKVAFLLYRRSCLVMFLFLNLGIR